MNTDRKDKETEPDRVNRILEHPDFQRQLDRLYGYEKDRPFCRHGMEHLLDVARLSLILYLEEPNQAEHIERDILYGASLLHDIGRVRQYEDKTPHEEESARLALKILRDCGYNEEEIRRIREAIAGHRNPDSARKQGLSGLLYRADKMSRSCFACKMEPQCGWKDDKKNRRLCY